jgi:hypothetical protein
MRLQRSASQEHSPTLVFMDDKDDLLPKPFARIRTAL